MITIVAVLALILSNGFIAADRPVEDVRKLNTFTGIGVGVHADVFYTSGNNHEIRIEGDGKDVQDLITEVKDGFLHVKYKSWRTRHSKVTLYITSKELDAVRISGSSEFMCADPITADEMDLAMSGSGSILFEKLEAEEVGVAISGSGDIELISGSADELDVRISGSGKLNAETFKVSELSASISGSGSVRITANEELDVRISGSGTVYYHGAPRVNSSSSGSGKTVAL